MIKSFSNTSADIQEHSAILYLPTPPQPEWYSKKIAGVPFLLRNLFALQKFGIKKLVLWTEEPMDVGLNKFLEEMKAEKRLELSWSCERSLSSFSNESSFLVFCGSTLIDEFEPKTKIVRGNMNSLSFFPESLKQISQKKELYFLQSANSEQPYELQNEQDLKEAEDRLLKSGGLNNDSFMDRLVTRFISRQLTRKFLKTSFTPNQITFLSLFVGLVAALCFFVGGYQMGIAGAVLLLLSAWIDCTDGEVARLKFMVSEWGAKFDIIADNIVHCFVFFSIGMGLFYSTGKPVFKYLGMLAVLGSFCSFIFLSKSILGKKAEATKKSSPEPAKNDITDQLANRDFTYFLFVLALFGRLDVFIFLAAVGSNGFAIYLACRKSQINSA